jgi:hypothetical protein
MKPNSERSANSREGLARIGADRKRLWTNGYLPVALLSHDHPEQTRAGKAPVRRKWADDNYGEKPSEDASGKPATPGVTNTGVNTRGLRGFDIDCGNPFVVAAIVKAVFGLLGPTIIRTRANSARCLLVYQDAEGEHGKVTLRGTTHSDSPDKPDKIEVLGKGQQFAALGIHASGAALEWEDDHSPLTVPRDQLTAVTEEQVHKALETVAPLIGADAKDSSSRRGDRTARAPLGPKPAHITGGPSVNRNAAANLDPQGFEALSADLKNQVIEEALARLIHRHSRDSLAGVV